MHSKSKHLNYSKYACVPMSIFFSFYFSMDVFQRLDSNSTLTSSKIASFEEAFVYLQKLMAAVKDILEGIQR